MMFVVLRYHSYRKGLQVGIDAVFNDYDKAFDFTCKLAHEKKETLHLNYMKGYSSYIDMDGFKCQPWACEDGNFFCEITHFVCEQRSKGRLLCIGSKETINSKRKMLTEDDIEWLKLRNYKYEVREASENEEDYDIEKGLYFDKDTDDCNNDQELFGCIVKRISYDKGYDCWVWAIYELPLS